MGDRQNDVFHGMTAKQIWHDCVWHSDENYFDKLFLLCIGRFFDAEGGASSISMAQIAEACGISMDTAKRSARRVTSRWLKVGVQKGYMTRFGRQNLYTGIIPEGVLESLRTMREQQQLRAATFRQGGCPQHTPRGVLSAGGKSLSRTSKVSKKVTIEEDSTVVVEGDADCGTYSHGNPLSAWGV